MANDQQFHYHEPKPGLLVRCYHKSKHWASPVFLAGLVIVNTITFPFEHWLWEKVWPFYRFSDWLNSASQVPWWVSAIVLALWGVALLVLIINWVRS